VNWPLDEAQRTASGEGGQRRGLAASSPYLHGGPNGVERGGLIHQGARPQSYGRLKLAGEPERTSRPRADPAKEQRNARPR
jgi:hypothetical protein